MKPRLTLWLIILISLLSLWIDLPRINIPFQLPWLKIPITELTNKFPLRLGLDLQGGSELILLADVEKLPEDQKDVALEAARQVIEKRVNLYGVSEAIVQSSRLGSQRRILIELPGVNESSSAASLVGKTAQLDFRELEATPSPEATQSAFAYLNSFKPTDLTGADLKKAQVTFNASKGKGSGAAVAIEFTQGGTKKFAEITKRNVKKPLAIFLDNQLITFPPPVVESEILGGNAVITGNFTTEEAKNLSIQLNAGALPVPIKILQQHSIGANLGQQSINRSLVAGIIGLSIVMFYMIAYYSWYGLLADLALVIYTLITLAIFKTGFFILPPITLTLAGIAGFILSIGMAVDANILIFERMKEERRLGNSRKTSLDLGFKRAWSSIRDSNISSLITAGILYFIGTGLIKGFAITLAIGVLVSMFTAVTVTRTFLRLVISK